MTRLRHESSREPLVSPLNVPTKVRDCDPACIYKGPIHKTRYQKNKVSKAYWLHIQLRQWLSRNITCVTSSRSPGTDESQQGCSCWAILWHHLSRLTTQIIPLLSGQINCSEAQVATRDVRSSPNTVQFPAQIERRVDNRIWLLVVYEIWADESHLELGYRAWVYQTLRRSLSRWVPVLWPLSTRSCKILEVAYFNQTT